MDFQTIRRYAEDIQSEISRVFIGKEDAIQMIIAALFSGSHVLIEDNPGVGKTTLSLALAKACSMDFSRIQFTPDLLPGDIVGMNIWDPIKREFIFKKGSAMTEFLLADELNRATARTQSALLEVMQEEKITVDAVSYPVSKSFFVIATQNPKHFTGTFPLSESQLDRFGLSVHLGYPTSDESMRILDLHQEGIDEIAIQAVVKSADIANIRRIHNKVFVHDKVKRYIVAIAEATHSTAGVKLGLSQRGMLHLMRISQIMAILSKRDFVIPEDVLKLIPFVLTHKIILSGEVQFKGQSKDNLIHEICRGIPIPTGAYD